MIGNSSIAVTTPVRVSYALHEAAFDQPLTVKATITEICPEDGCWIVLSDNANLLRVELDEISELTSTEWKGKELTVTGRLQRKVVLPSGKGYKDYERVCKENNTQPGLEPIVLMKALRIDMTE